MTKTLIVLLLACGSLVAQTSVRVAVGRSTTYVDSVGNTWSADTGCSGTSAVYSNPNSIGATADPALYQTGRVGLNFACSYTVTAPGFYNVTAKFANTFGDKLSDRIFNVTVNNGAGFLQSLDLMRVGGGIGNVAIDRTFLIDVSSATATVTINIDQINNKGILSAIDIEPAQAVMPTSTFANLGTPTDGNFVYCTNCAKNTDPCTGASTGAVAERIAGVWVCGSAAGSAISSLTTDVVATGPGAAVATIQPASVSLAKMANLAANTIIGNNTGVGATPLALTAAQIKTLLAIACADLTNASAACSSLTNLTLITPALGTPTSGVMTNVTGLTESGQTLADVTTLNVSTTKHGYVPKAPNDVTKFLDGTGAFSVPSGGGTKNIWTGSFISTSSAGTVTNVSPWQLNAAAGNQSCDAITTTAPAPAICYHGLTNAASQNISYQFFWDSTYTAIDFKFAYFGNYNSPAVNNVYRFGGRLICQTLGTVYTSGTWTAGATTTSASSSAAAYQTVTVSLTSIAIPTCANGSAMIFQLTRDQSVTNNSTDEARLMTGNLLAH